MADRAGFLENIRHRTRSGQYKPTNAPDAAWTRTPERPFTSERIEDPPSRFLEELGSLGGHGERVATMDEARDYVVALARERGAKLLLRWDVEDLDRVDEALAGAGVEVVVWRDLEDFREVASRADIGLSTAALAIAETVPVQNLVRTVPEAIERYAQSGGLPANLCFHTGPSRSGDIEMSLAIGVHGPGDVHVLLVG